MSIILIVMIIIIFSCIYIFYESKIYKSTYYYNKQQYDSKINYDNDYANDLKNKEIDLDIQLNVDELYNIAKIHHYGTFDRYDSSGMLIKGIHPNPELAIPIYNKLISPQINYIKCIDDLCQLYHHSVPGYEYLIDINKAKIYYIMKYELDKNPETLGILKDLAFYTNDHTLYYELIDTTLSPFTSTLKPTLTNKTTRKGVINTTGFQRRTNTVHNITDSGKLAEYDRDDLSVVIKNDMHNVHDSTLLNTIKSSVNKLKKSTNINIDIPTTINLIKKDIESCNEVSSDRKRMAHQALNMIVKSNENISSVNMKELDIINLVYNRIQNGDDIDTKKVLKENLINELSECVEHEKAVCPSGRFTRVIDSINFIDPDVEIKPKWILQKEMVEKAGNIYKKKFDSLDKRSQDAINSINMDSQQTVIYNNIKNQVRNEIEQSFTNDYVKTDILTKDSLDYELNKWVDTLM
jgi:hypothetical protein